MLVVFGELQNAVWDPAVCLTLVRTAAVAKGLEHFISERF
jgi:hypothetical protein